MLQAGINLPFITADATGPKHLDMTLTRAKFNELTADLVEKTAVPLRKALEDASIKVSDIAQVILVVVRPAYRPCRKRRSKRSQAKIRIKASIRMSAWLSARRFRPA